MANVKIKRKKASLGAIVPILSTVLSTGASIYGNVMQNNNQQRMLRKQERLADYQNDLNNLSSTQQALNGYSQMYNTVNRDYIPYAKGGKLRGHGGVLVENGGTPHYLGNNTIYYTGRKHKDGGINTNFGGVPANIEGGETSFKLGNNYIILNNRMHLKELLGKTPSWWGRHYPNNDEVKRFAYEAQEMHKAATGKTDSGERKAIYDMPPVGRIKAAFGDTLPGGASNPYYIYSMARRKDPTLPYWSNYNPTPPTPKYNRYSFGYNPADHDYYGRGWLESIGSQFYNPKDYTIDIGGKTYNYRPPGYAKFQSSYGLDLPEVESIGKNKVKATGKPDLSFTIPDVHEAWQTGPDITNAKKAAYEQKGMYDNWWARNGLKLYTADVAAAAVQGIAPWFANTIYNKRFEDTDKLFGNLSKAVSNASPIQAAYSGMDTRNPMQWAEYADRIRRGQEERRDFASKLNSQMALQGIAQKSLTEQGIDTNKIFDKYAEQNFNARVKDAELRNQMAAANMESANRFNLGKYQTLAEITRDQTANMDAKYQSNADAINASIGAFSNLINVGKQQYDYEQQRALALQMLRGSASNKDVLDAFDKAIPPYMYDWRTNPYLREMGNPNYNLMNALTYKWRRR